MEHLARLIRDIPNFPKEGILFKDITPLFSSADSIAQTNKALAEVLAESYDEDDVCDVVVGIESRGFLFGPMISLMIDASFALARKPGKLPYEKISISYDLEYGSTSIEMHTDSIKPGDKVIIHDDLLATGGTALAAAELAIRAGIPAGVVNIITADSDNSIAIGKVFCSSDIVRHISFTGSTEVGRILMAQSAPSIKKLALELGGNAPFIVFDDANIDSAVEGAMASKYRNAGQTCVCANRIYVQDAVYDEFVQKFSAKVKTLKVGNGFDEGVVQGPLIENAAVEKVERHVQDAIHKGGKVMVGGRKLEGQFFEPTVIAEARADMLCAREETFGPFAPVFRFHKDQEAIDAANNTEFGLASYFYSRDIGRIYRVSEALEYGMVGINVGIIATEHVPFGGVKQSGLGREGSKHGMDEYLEMKYLCLGDILK